MIKIWPHILSNIIPLHLNETRPWIFDWKLKFSTPNKQILQILGIFKTNLELFSTIRTIQNFFSSPFPLICNINQRRIKENIKLFNCKKINRLFCSGRKKINFWEFQVMGSLSYLASFGSSTVFTKFSFTWFMPFSQIYSIFSSWASSRNSKILSSIDSLSSNCLSSSIQSMKSSLYDSPSKYFISLKLQTFLLKDWPREQSQTWLLPWSSWFCLVFKLKSLSMSRISLNQYSIHCW